MAQIGTKSDNFLLFFSASQLQQLVSMYHDIKCRKIKRRVIDKLQSTPYSKMAIHMGTPQINMAIC